ncbi:L-xylulose reductase-like [Oppia nitens]|uniref:L-xylulose reductase-like n=1 Tax=Oppia nitens TaxID=1686743 RepID=UPI0023DB58B5|nr:L-xylulose reductase-like [Oppia nitens]
MCDNFNGKRALVTGAGRGIGREIVKQLVAANARVVALSKTQENLDSLKQELPSIETVCCDIGNWDETKTKVAAIGTVDLLVNNAAYAALTPLGTIDEAIVDKHFNINVKSVINITQIVATGMKSRGTGGSIVNISSVAGMIGIRDHLVYGATKGALDLMTKVWALELGADNIRVNSLNPTVTLTEMGLVGWSDPKVRDPWLAQHPMHRFCKPQDVANTVLYLLSDRSDMITGTILPIDGGLTCV